MASSRLRAVEAAGMGMLAEREDRADIVDTDEDRGRSLVQRGTMSRPSRLMLPAQQDRLLHCGNLRSVKTDVMHPF